MKGLLENTLTFLCASYIERHINGGKKFIEFVIPREGNKELIYVKERADPDVLRKVFLEMSESTQKNYCNKYIGEAYTLTNEEFTIFTRILLCYCNEIGRQYRNFRWKASTKYVYNISFVIGCIVNVLVAAGLLYSVFELPYGPHSFIFNLTLGVLYTWFIISVTNASKKVSDKLGKK